MCEFYEANLCYYALSFVFIYSLINPLFRINALESGSFPLNKR
jgi:hypothetical protein